MNKYVAKMIVLAQIASDSGKNIHRIQLKNAQACKNAIKSGYRGKDMYIHNAICGILRDKSSGFTFHISADNTFVDALNLVYFNFKLDGQRKQISFHSFDSWMLKFHENHLFECSSNSCRTRWDNKSSYKTAQELADYIDF